MGHPESFRGVDIETHCRGIGLNLLEWCSPPVWEQWFPTHGDAAVPGENYFWKRSLHGLLHTAFPGQTEAMGSIVRGGRKVTEKRAAVQSLRALGQANCSFRCLCWGKMLPFCPVHSLVSHC